MTKTTLIVLFIALLAVHDVVCEEASTATATTGTLPRQSLKVESKTIERKSGYDPTLNSVMNTALEPYLRLHELDKTAAASAAASASASGTKTGPFSTRNAASTEELAVMIDDLGKLSDTLAAQPTPSPLPTHNTQEDIALAQLTKKVSAREATATDDGKEQKKVADPFEISILSKLSQKVRRIQDIAVSNAFSTVPQTTPENVVLEQLVTMLRGIRQSVAARPVQQHVSSRAEGRRLRQMQRLLRKMRKLDNNKQISQQEFQARSAKLHNKMLKLQQQHY
eukprot:TRINITY_DN114_c0_g1_i2.p1 TRINITY_DN114_c0_g1~~TRINITY_DN114_c0_g1_i2.p1  ORF type:complete len:281 (+),score=62.17 TRINITY_DN114_c0_g1_i2:39-881(+)